MIVTTNQIQKTVTHKQVSCPFCSLLCDDLSIKADNGRLELEQHGCDRAKRYFEQAVANASAKIDGKSVSLQAAIAQATRILKKSRNPLFSGLGTDVSGMRAVMALADKYGAIVDHMHSGSLFNNILVLQDLGWIMTTMAEIKNRADLIIFAGTDAVNYPRFFERVIWNKHAMFKLKPAARKIVYIGEELNIKPGYSPSGQRPTIIHCKQDNISELFSALHAIVAGSQLDKKEVAGVKLKILEELAAQMKRARYGVIVWEPERFAIPHAELTIQHLCELMKYLTRITRFAGFSLGGNDGAITASSVCAWQSGYPLGVNFNKAYPDYDAYRYTTQNVLKNKEVDTLLWISSFTCETLPPKVKIPTIVLAKPDVKLRFRPTVFIPVATPGVDHAGQLLRTDNTVALPLKKLRDTEYLSVGKILELIYKA